MGKMKRRQWRNTGWHEPIRRKASVYADKGYAYEVRLMHKMTWSQHADQLKGYYDVIETMKKSTERCHVAGMPRWNQTSRRRLNVSIRLYLGSEQDLFLLRLLAPDVFRIYRLHPLDQASSPAVL